MSMSSRKSFTAPRRFSESAGEVIDIDVTPVMNMFIILVPFLISVAVFTNLSITELSLPSGISSGTAQGSEKPQLKTTVVLHEHYIAITYGERVLDSIPNVNNTYNFDAFALRLVKGVQETDTREEVIVAVRDKVRFKHVIAIMDICRENGFKKVGLSSASIEGNQQ